MKEYRVIWKSVIMGDQLVTAKNMKEAKQKAWGDGEIDWNDDYEQIKIVDIEPSE